MQKQKNISPYKPLIKRANKPIQLKKGNENKQTNNKSNKTKNERTRKGAKKNHLFLRLKYFSLVGNILS